MKIHIHDETNVIVLEIEGDVALLEAIKIAEDEALWLENADDPIEVGICADDLGVGHHLHLHRSKRRIDVEVYYNNQTKSKRFGPGSTVERVFEWAVGRHGFNIDATAAADLVLHLQGHTDALDVGAHIGNVAKQAHEVKLDLLPADRFAG